jgi:drug/metabolite transporter (DMT)-like permease
VVGFVVTWSGALTRAPATYVAVLLVPATLVTNVLSAVFITHQFPTVQYLNASLVTLGVALLIRFAKKSPKQTVMPSASIDQPLGIAG